MWVNKRIIRNSFEFFTLCDNSVNSKDIRSCVWTTQAIQLSISFDRQDNWENCRQTFRQPSQSMNLTWDWTSSERIAQRQLHIKRFITILNLVPKLGLKSLGQLCVNISSKAYLLECESRAAFLANHKRCIVNNVKVNASSVVSHEVYRCQNTLQFRLVCISVESPVSTMLRECNQRLNICGVINLIGFTAWELWSLECNFDGDSHTERLEQRASNFTRDFPNALGNPKLHPWIGSQYLSNRLSTGCGLEWKSKREIVKHIDSSVTRRRWHWICVERNFSFHARS